MIKYSLVSLLFIIALCTSCKTMVFDGNVHKLTTTDVTLGSVGLIKNNRFSSTYNNAAIPTYSTPIKVDATILPFEKSSYLAYTQAASLQSKNITVLNDSLYEKPKFVQIHIADKLALIKALNANENASIKTYLGFNKDASIVTDISISYPEDILQSIKNADAIFLEEYSKKSYALQLHVDGKETEKVLLSDGVVFTYKSAKGCWKQDKRRKLQIVDFTNTNKCSKNTFKVADKARKKQNLF